MTPRRRRLALVALLLSCSTLAPLPEETECQSDEDCPDPLVCATDQGICRDASELPPQAQLSFDVREPQAMGADLRLELRGCDAETILDSSEEKVLLIPRTQVAQGFILQLLQDEPLDPENPTLTDFLPSSVEVTQPSRFGNRPTTLTQRISAYPEISDDGMGNVTVLESLLRWPRYHPEDRFPGEPADFERGGFLVISATPMADAMDNRASFFRMAVVPETEAEAPCPPDPSQCCATYGASIGCHPDIAKTCIPDFDGEAKCPLSGDPRFLLRYQYELSCSREVRGTAQVVESDDMGGLVLQGNMEGASAVLRHAHVPAGPRVSARSVLATRPCTTDGECSDGQICDATTESCGLDLDGRIAATPETDMTGEFVTNVYVYCESDLEGTFNRAFRVRMAPGAADGPAPSPSINFDEVALELPNSPMFNPRFEQAFCVPRWSGGHTVSLELAGAPVELLDTQSGGTTCCDTACLSDTADDGMQTAPSTCDGSAAGSPPQVELQTPFVAPDATDWEALDCSPLDVDNAGNAGSLRRDATCPGDGPCLAEMIPTEGLDGTLTYTITVQTPVGSVLGSRIVDGVEFDAAVPPAPIALPRRALLRGRITLPQCVDGGDEMTDCGAEEAVVLAERLALPGVTIANTPGPYFHDAPTFAQPDTGQLGQYVMPLDPGVYAVTALPQPRAPGGPARIVIVDLRDGADRSADFILDTGTLVSLDLGSFDRRSTVAPVDTGSWRPLGLLLDESDPASGIEFDLNTPGTCLSTDSDAACRIRQLTPPDARLFPNQARIVRFSARIGAPGGATCPAQ